MAKKTQPQASASDRLELAFDVTFAATLALREKQIQQNYRPVIGIHKWFARRPGTLFRSLLLAEFGEPPLHEAYWKSHQLQGTIADPFMGGGTSLYEASRLGFGVVGCDINPMSHWLVTRAFADLDIEGFANSARKVATAVEQKIGSLYTTRCTSCQGASTVKYFLWVKQATCPRCNTENDLFPGHLLAEDERHPRNVLVCEACGELGEYEHVPKADTPASCHHCAAPVQVEGRVRRGKCTCRGCARTFPVPSPNPLTPVHRMWAIEYHCPTCYPKLKGRQFKRPDAEDNAKHSDASTRLAASERHLLLPEDEISAGDETDRLHRWGYRRFRDMFNSRQLLALGILKETIREESEDEIRSALLTVFSDILRYNNMLCRYDTYALKCQDIFSVHGFPVGLVQCENNVLGIPGVGSGGFNHFIEKYIRAKEFCRKPFEVRTERNRKTSVPMEGETIGTRGAGGLLKPVELHCAPGQSVNIPPGSLDGVFTDPPYFANVQYSELMDFCYVWLRAFVDSAAFAGTTTRSTHEATGNSTQGRGILEFTTALSAVFSRFAVGLKPGRPFVFTYHHNDPSAYAPLIVAILDAGLTCSAVLPAAAEMSASLHISGTNSSVLDSVFVCRATATHNSGRDTPLAYPLLDGHDFSVRLQRDIASVAAAGVRVGIGDVRCLASGLVAKMAIRDLHAGWPDAGTTADKLRRAQHAIASKSSALQFPETVARTFASIGRRGQDSLPTQETDVTPV